MKTINKIRADFDYALSLDNGFGRKTLTLALLSIIVVLAYSIVLWF
jgi:hypothetical protein